MSRTYCLHKGLVTITKEAGSDQCGSKQYRLLNKLPKNAFILIIKGGGVQEKESIMGHRIEISIFNPRDDRAVWYLGGASVPSGPVIPRVENANL